MKLLMQSGVLVANVVRKHDVGEARISYMLALSKAASYAPKGNGRPNCCFGEADVATLSKQVELALLYDAKLDLAK
jgi:hypothetical protein